MGRSGDMTPARRTPDTVIERVAVAAAMLLPVGFLYTRGGSEILIAIIDAMFLVHCTMHGRWSWLRNPWMLMASAWWGWVVLCSTLIAAAGPGGDWHSWGQALLIGRFFVLVAALAEWLLKERAVRRAMAWMVAACAAWIVVQSWQQYLLGTNIFGEPRWGDGALTGPFNRPRAGPALVLILFPAMLPPVLTLLDRRGWWPRITALLLALLGVATVVLIGQRMPAVLTALGLVVCGVLLPRLRPVVIAVAVLVVALLAAMPVLSPPTFAKLVVHFSDQMAHFAQSPYGLLYVRATVMSLDHPLIGLGFDGFRHGCYDALYQRGLPWLGISDAQAGGPAGCSIHPHNHYLEAATSGGIPGLLLFCAMVGSWLVTLGRGLLRDPAGRRVALFTAVLIAVWPLASTSAFFTLPNAGWLFLLLGAGLAETARATEADEAMPGPTHQRTHGVRHPVIH
jgi:O-antigen ligase